MKRTLLTLTVLLVIILSACNLPLGMPAGQQASPPEVPSLEAQPVTTATLAPVDLLGPEPVMGATVRWYDGSILVYVPSGEFLMGHGGTDNPQHSVFLDGFWVYRTKVTNDMYARCVRAGKCIPPGPDTTLPDFTDPLLKDHPIVGVTWEQAQSYCQWVDGRLPSEAEWEKTARGPNGKIYPWGDAQPTCDLSNHASCVGHLTNVLEYPAGMSEYQAFDFSGNTFEWVADWYKAAYYSESPTENPIGPEVGDVRSVRGSSYSSTAEQIRPSTRYFSDPKIFRPDLGFRCVVGNAQEYAPACETSPAIGEPKIGKVPAVETPACEPPPLAVTVETYCQKKYPYANVNLNGATNLDMGGGNCSPAGDLYVCSGESNQTFTMSACTSCVPPTPVPSTITPACPTGYVFDTAGCQCVYMPEGNSTGTRCPGNFLSMFYQPQQQCCHAQPIEPNEPLCSPGYVLSGCYCVSGTTETVETVMACEEFKVSLPDCDRESGCSGCACYKDIRSCYAAGCKWDKTTNSCK